MFPTKNIFLFTLIILISSCGYQLRGSIDLPEELESIFLQGGSEQLRKIMHKTLKSSGGSLVDTIGQAKLVVQVVKERIDKRVLSLSQTGRANEYELIYDLEFNILTTKGRAISEKQRIEISKDYFNDQEEVLGKDNEEQVIRDEMYRKAVESIINRSRIALENNKR